VTRTAFFPCCLAALLAGCGPTPVPPPPAGVARLEVLLPKLRTDLGERYPTTLTIAGKEHSVAEAKDGRLVLDVDLPDGESAVAEISFWPNTYSTTFRKRSFTPHKGKVVTIDLREQGPDDPDHFKAIFVPTPDEPVAEALKMAKVGAEDTLLDIGCGDGKVVIQAVKAGAKRAVGVDIRPDLVELSKENAKKAGVADRCEFRVEDAFKMKGLSEFSVVFMCLGEDLQTQLMPVLKKMPKGTRIVAVTHLIEGWTPDETRRVDVPSKGWKYPVYLWTVK
jgi:precorrin-6B methylase 2